MVFADLGLEGTASVAMTSIFNCEMSGSRIATLVKEGYGDRKHDLGPSGRMR